TRFSRDWSSDVCSSDLCLSKQLSPHVSHGANLWADPAFSDVGSGNQRPLGRVFLHKVKLQRRKPAEPSADGEPETVLQYRQCGKIGRASCRERGESVEV